MRELAELLNEMVDKGVIKNYAIFGAMAQIRYAEPVATLDINVLVGVSEVERIDILREIYSYCEKKGYSTKDFARILALHEAGAVTWHEISTITNQYGLSHEWNRFKKRFQIQ